MTIAVGSDHAGFELRQALSAWLKSARGGKHRVVDVGCHAQASCDYPDFAALVAHAVSRKRAAYGILICGTGIGMAIAANKVTGIRAAVAWTPEVAGLAAEHNKANVLCIPARFVTLKEAQRIIGRFLSTPFGKGRHTRRVRKINQLTPCV